jgi:hypothetical protein
MNLTRFEALGLLRQGDARKFNVGVEDLFKIIENRGFLLGRNADKRLGYLIFAGSLFWLKPCRKKVERFLRERQAKISEYHIGERLKRES